MSGGQNWGVVTSQKSERQSRLFNRNIKLSKLDLRKCEPLRGAVLVERNAYNNHDKKKKQALGFRFR